MRHPDPSPEYSLVVLPEKLDPDGETFRLAPAPAQLSAIAQRLGLLALSRFDGEVAVTPWGRGGWQIAGTFTAIVRQECVVSLEPFEEGLEETFVVRYLPQKALTAYEKDDEVMVGEVTDEDPPELLPSSGIDIGELAVEYLSLSLDPYPRKPGADKSPIPRENSLSSAPKENPFSVLKDLKKTT